MQRELFEVKRERFHLLDPDIYILQGSWPKDYEPDVWLDNEPVVEVTLEDWENTSALERFTDLDMMRGKKVTMSLRLPPLKNRKKLKIFAVNGDERILLLYRGRKSQSFFPDAEGKGLGRLERTGGHTGL